MHPTTSTGKHRPSSTVRQSKDAALSEREWELLYRGARAIDCPVRSLEAEFVTVAAGRLGMRGGEIAHLRADWINWRDRLIEIPKHEPCQKGRDGGPCGYCRQQAKQMVEHNDGLTLEDAVAGMWSPKTINGARGIPFSFDTRVELVIEEFDDRFDGFEHSRQAVNRRVDEAAENAAGIDAEKVFPHGLRATAASFHASRGIGSGPLKALLGWGRLDTAESYVEVNGRAVARALESAHSR